VCPSCGNRYYGNVGGRVQGFAPVAVSLDPKPELPPARPVHFTTERMANLCQGTMNPKVEGETHKFPWGAPDPANKNDKSGGKPQIKTKEERPMQIKECANCGRVKGIVGEKCCYVCYHAGKGLVGVAKDEARAAVKAKIERGEPRRGGPGKKKTAPEGGKQMDEAEVSAVIFDAVRDDQKGTRLFVGAPAAASEGANGIPFVPPNPAATIHPNTERWIAARAVVGVDVICLDFADDRDRALHAALIAEAARLRRTPEQQILWMLQNAIEPGKGLLAEASGR
jgi:hypothetical protein